MLREEAGGGKKKQLKLQVYEEGMLYQMELKEIRYNPISFLSKSY